MSKRFRITIVLQVKDNACLGEVISNGVTYILVFSSNFGQMCFDQNASKIAVDNLIR